MRPARILGLATSQPNAHKHTSDRPSGRRETRRTMVLHGCQDNNLWPALVRDEGVHLLRVYVVLLALALHCAQRSPQSHDDRVAGHRPQRADVSCESPRRGQATMQKRPKTELRPIPDSSHWMRSGHFIALRRPDALRPHHRLRPLDGRRRSNAGTCALPRDGSRSKHTPDARADGRRAGTELPGLQAAALGEGWHGVWGPSVANGNGRSGQQC